MEEYLKKVSNSKAYFTVADYLAFLENEFGLKRPKIDERKNLYKGTGLVCASICDERNIVVERKPHNEFGTINSYPEYILAEAVLGEAYKKYFPLYSPLLAIRYPSVPRRNKPGP